MKITLEPIGVILFCNEKLIINWTDSLGTRSTSQTVGLSQMSVSRLSKKNFSNPVCILRFTSTSSFSQQNKLLVSQRGFKQIIVTVSHNVMKEHTSSLVFRNHFSSSKQAGFQHSAGSYSASDRNKPCKQMSAHTHVHYFHTIVERSCFWTSLGPKSAAFIGMHASLD